MKKTPWTYYWVAFGGDYVGQLVKRRVISAERPILAAGINEIICHCYRCLLDRVRSALPGMQQLIGANTMEILGAALAAAEQPPASEELGTAIERARRILEQQAERKWTWSKWPPR